MSAGVVNRFADACVTSAARRWPEDLAMTMASEWRAELAALRADRTLHPAIRAWRALRFAASLAMSPSVEPENPMGVMWRDRLPRIGNAATAAIGVVGIALLARVLYGLTSSGAEKGNLDDHFSTGVVAVINLACLALAVAALGWLGTIMARRRPVDHRGAVAAIAHTAPLALAMWLVLGAPGADYEDPSQWIDTACACGGWFAVATVTVAAVLRLAKAGHRTAAWFTAIGGNLIALDVAAIAGGLRTAVHLHAGYGFAAAWFPLSTLPDNAVGFGRYFTPIAYGSPGFDPSVYAYQGYASVGLLRIVGTFAGPMLLCSAFLVAFTMRATRVTESRPVAVAAAQSPARITPRTRLVSGAGVVIGVAAWAYLDAVGTLHTEIFQNVSDNYDAMWMRLLAIAVITVAAIILLAGRGPVVAAATALFAVLFATDCVINNSHWHGVAGAVIVVVVSAAALSGMQWLVTELAGPATTADSARSALIGVAVLSCALIQTPPGLQSSCNCGTGPQSITVLTYVFAVGLWLLSITAALASRPTPLGRLATVAYVVVPVAVLTVPTAGWVPHFTFDPFFFPVSVFSVQLALMVTALAAARWHAGMRSVVRWLLFGIGAVALAHPLVDQITNNGGLLAYPLVRLDYGQLLDPDPYFSGQLVLGIVFAVIGARWRLPPGTSDIAVRPIEPQVDPSPLADALAQAS